MKNKMAQILTKKQKDRQENRDWDIQVYLNDLWLEKMATSSFYDDATIPHNWRCNCCSRTLFLSEERK